MSVALQPLVLPISFPLVAGLICLLIPKRFDKERTVIAVAAAALTLVRVLSLFSQQGAVLDQGWLHLRLDGLSALVLLATSVFALLITVYSTGYMKGRKQQRTYYTCLLWTLSASCGVALANDLVLLLVFWGFLGLTLYLMVSLAGPDASAAAKKTFIMVGGSDAVLMLGIALVWHLTGSTRMDGAALPLTGGTAYVAFLSLVAAAFAKAGAMPLHTWLPDCGEKADAPVSAFLPASLDKLLGIYLLARAATSLFELNPAMNQLLMLAGAVTIVFAVMMALVQHDLKRLLSYHAVSQVGYMVLGIGTGTAVGIAGGLFHMLNNAIYKSCLFLCAGSVEKEAGTSDLDRLGGLAKAMPLTFAACLVAALSISGIPPLNGFASKWMVYQGVVESGQGGGLSWVLWLVAAMLGSALTLASFAKVLHATYLAKPSPELARKSLREVGIAMWLPTTILATLCIVLGVLAHRFAIPRLIGPALEQPLVLSGVWWAGPATAMLVAAMVAGLMVYYFTMRGGKLRRCETYVGGEHLADAYRSGTERGAERDVEVTGVDFYRTVQDITPLRSLYRKAEQKYFDVYEVGTKCMFYFVELLRSAHSGALPMYLSWFVLGLLVVLYVLIKAG